MGFMSAIKANKALRLQKSKKLCVSRKTGTMRKRLSFTRKRSRKE